MNEIYVIRDPDGVPVKAEFFYPQKNTVYPDTTEGKMHLALYRYWLSLICPMQSEESPITGKFGFERWEEESGYTGHPLHVYNPETQVVISRECYGMLLDHAIQPSKSMYFSDFDKVWALWQEFIKAGNNPLVPIEDTTNE